MITPIVESRLNVGELQRLKEAYKRADGSYVTVGVHEGVRGYGGKNPPTVGQVALWMEYGAPKANVPARPFMGPAVAEHRSDISQQMGRLLAQMAYNQITVELALDKLGRQVVLFIKSKIEEGPGAPLSGSWDPPRGYLGRKRALNQPSQTLIATRLLHDSIANRVTLGSAAQAEASAVAHESHSTGNAGHAAQRAHARAERLLRRSQSRGMAGRDEHGRFIKRK